MLKPYTRNRRIYDYLVGSFGNDITEYSILREILTYSLWEVVLDKGDTSSVLYKDIPLTDKVRLVARVIGNGSTSLEVFSTLGHGIGGYYSYLRDYYDCSSPMHERLIMLDTGMSYEEVLSTITRLSTITNEVYG